MSEHIKIETESSDDESIMYVYTNLRLAEGQVEEYGSVEEMEEGSPLAQSMSVVQGIVALRLEAGDLVVTRESGTPWHAIVGDIAAILKEFFL